MLHDEELRLQDVKNEYVLGMVESVNDKDQHRYALIVANLSRVCAFTLTIKIFYVILMYRCC